MLHFLETRKAANLPGIADPSWRNLALFSRGRRQAQPVYVPGVMLVFTPPTVMVTLWPVGAAAVPPVAIVSDVRQEVSSTIRQMIKSSETVTP
jgi:hypothetical protein